MRRSGDPSDGSPAEYLDDAHPCITHCACPAAASQQPTIAFNASPPADVRAVRVSQEVARTDEEGPGVEREPAATLLQLERQQDRRRRDE